MLEQSFGFVLIFYDSFCYYLKKLFNYVSTTIVWKSAKPPTYLAGVNIDLLAVQMRPKGLGASRLGGIHELLPVKHHIATAYNTTAHTEANINTEINCK